MSKMLYHGTKKDSAKNIEKKGVDLSYSRKNLDFGAGFYLTTHKGQAKDWAYKRDCNNAAIVAFEANLDGLKIKKFYTSDDEWGNAIYENRVNGIDILKDYDVVIGRMADGKIDSLVNDVKNGIMTKEEFIAEISKDIGTQIVFKTDAALAKLKYLNKETVK